jgi:prophage regulatory protein
MNISIRMLRLPDVIEKTALSRSQIYRLVALGTFPGQIQLGDRASGWIEEEVERWLLERIERSRKRDLAAAVGARVGQ